MFRKCGGGIFPQIIEKVITPEVLRFQRSAGILVDHLGLSTSGVDSPEHWSSHLASSGESLGASLKNQSVVLIMLSWNYFSNFREIN